MNDPAPLHVASPGGAISQQTLTADGHEVERAVMQRLQNHPSLRFSRLNVHQCGRDTICLEGFLESNVDGVDLCDVVQGIHGIKSVVNHVVNALPKKG